MPRARTQPETPLCAPVHSLSSSAASHRASALSLLRLRLQPGLCAPPPLLCPCVRVRASGAAPQSSVTRVHQVLTLRRARTAQPLFGLTGAREGDHARTHARARTSIYREFGGLDGEQLDSGPEWEEPLWSLTGGHVIRELGIPQVRDVVEDAGGPRVRGRVLRSYLVLVPVLGHRPPPSNFSRSSPLLRRSGSGRRARGDGDSGRRREDVCSELNGEADR